MVKVVEPAVEAGLHVRLHRTIRVGAGRQLAARHAPLRRFTATSKRNRERVILVAHALSASARVGDWWPDLFGADGPFNLDHYCILGINILGSCYGSTGPTSFNPATQKQYGPDFPIITIGDIVRAQSLLLEHLRIPRTGCRDRSLDWRHASAGLGAAFSGARASEASSSAPLRWEPWGWHSITCNACPSGMIRRGRTAGTRSNRQRDSARRARWLCFRTSQRSYSRNATDASRTAMVKIHLRRLRPFRRRRIPRPSAGHLREAFRRQHLRHDFEVHGLLGCAARRLAAISSDGKEPR